VNLDDILVQLIGRIARLEQRLDTTVVHGKVTDVDTEKQLARVQMGGADGETYKSPWVPYGQTAGALKVHAPPSVGQNMTLINPAGDPSQGVLMPMTWNNQNASPSTKNDENVLTFGNVRIEIKNDRLFLKVGGSEITVSGDKLQIKAATEFEGDSVKHKGKAIDNTHKHLGVRRGGETSDEPA